MAASFHRAACAACHLLWRARAQAHESRPMMMNTHTLHALHHLQLGMRMRACMHQPIQHCPTA